MPSVAEKYDPRIVQSASFISLPASGIALVSRLKDDVYIGEPGIEDSFITAPYDRWTGVPLENPDWRPIRLLTPELLEILRTWRNEFDIPWSTAAYEKPYTMETVHNHSIRLAIGNELATYDQEDKLIRYIYEAENLVKPGEELPTWDELEEMGINRIMWFDKNVSAYAPWRGGMINLVAECFAWYTSPSYVKGNLPPQFEELLEPMIHAEHLGFAERLVRDEEREGGDLRQRVPSLLASLTKARQLPDPNKPLSELPIIGHNVHYFLFILQLEERGITFDEFLNQEDPVKPSK